MVKVKNTSDQGQSISGYKRFEPGEIRDVTKGEADVLGRNPFIEIVKNDKSKSDDLKDDKKNKKAK